MRARLEFLRDPDVRRVVVELVVVILVTILVSRFALEPVLVELFPGVFPESSIPQTGRRLPETAVGWARGLVVVAVGLVAFYFRIYHTDRGRRLQAKIRGAIDDQGLN